MLDGADPGRRWIGVSVSRVEDRHHLCGGGTFVDDLGRPRTLYASFVRSPYAAARIVSISTDEALATEGVECVLTAADLGRIPGLRPVLNRPEFVPTEMPLLARDRVRHVGEPVAMVLAASPHVAEDGAESVAVDYEPQAPITSIEAALVDGAPRVHEELPDNVLIDVQEGGGAALDEVLDSAPVVIDSTFTTGRVTASPIEARASLAEWDGREEVLVLHSSSQVPHILQGAVAQTMGLPEQRVRVIVPDVGGGFGQKCVVAREEVLVCVAARRTGWPVKWTEDRQENLMVAPHGHEQRYELRAAFDERGHLLTLVADIVCDIGAYSCYPFTCGVEPLMAASELPGVYRFRHYAYRARGVATNKAHMAPYRGVSRPQFTFAMERLMQKAARRVGVDIVEIRRRNLVRAEEFPYTSPSGVTYDKGSYRESLELCAKALDFELWPERRARAQQEGRLVGLGVSCFAERTAYGTRAFALRKMAITPGYESAHVRMDPSGKVTVMVGTCGHGQGHQTTLAQIAAEELDLDFADVIVRQGDTHTAPHGWGTFASRSLVVGGGATKRACAALAERLKHVAAHLLEADEADLELADGHVQVRGSPELRVAVPAVARAAYLEAHLLPEGEAGVIEGSASFDPPGTFSNACHGAVVEIDPDTGEVRVDRYVVVEDCGVVVNPMIVDGQVRGGVAQGIAAALYEQLVYDDGGQLLTSTFMDYLMPTASEIPPIEIHHLETPCEYTETGAKGMGEGGTMGAPAAVACAVADAVARLGIEIDSIPIAPAALAAAIKSARAEVGERR